MFSKIFFGMFLIQSFALADHECLMKATNSELLFEIERRLGNPPIGTGSIATYSCDNFMVLNFSVISPAGTEQVKKAGNGGYSWCPQQAEWLNAHKKQISQITLFGVCDGFANLLRYSITPNGTVNELSKITIGDVNRCLEEAKKL